MKEFRHFYRKQKSDKEIKSSSINNLFYIKVNFNFQANSRFSRFC